MVVLQKLGKLDYSDLGAYWPIALLNTLGKMLESIVARCLSELVEAKRLLLATQFGARPRHSTEDALLNIQEEVRAIWVWYLKKVVSLLSLDVSKAFDYVSHKRLLHNLYKWRVPLEIVN